MNATKDTPDVRIISAAQTRPMRQQVLRPGLTLDQLVYPGDDDDETRHFGAFLVDRIVGIASVYRRPMPERGDAADWQLRGMASLPELRGTGVGAAVLLATIDYVAAQGGRRYWCHARTGAKGFYRKHGFITQGGVYDIPGVGPHVLMCREIAPPET